MSHWIRACVRGKRDERRRAAPKALAPPPGDGAQRQGGPSMSSADAHVVVSPTKLFLIEFGENRVAVIAVVLLGLIVLLAIAAPLITPQNPYDLAKLVLTDARRPPGYVGSNGFTHWLGTDAQGRDLYSAIV